MAVSPTQTFKTPLTVDFSRGTTNKSASRVNNPQARQALQNQNRRQASMMLAPKKTNLVESAFSKVAKNVNLNKHPTKKQELNTVIKRAEKRSDIRKLSLGNVA